MLVLLLTDCEIYSLFTEWGKDEQTHSYKHNYSVNVLINFLTTTHILFLHNGKKNWDLTGIPKFTPQQETAIRI